MKHRIFTIRLLNLVLILALIVIYNSVLIYRSQQDEIARLSTKVEEYQMAEAAGADAEGAATGDDGGAGFKDGTYQGSSEGYGGQIVVSVTVAGGQITAIDIVSATGEDAAYLNMSKPMLDEIVATQNLEVDTVTGATLSSVGMRNAVIVALQQAI